MMHENITNVFSYHWINYSKLLTWLMWQLSAQQSLFELIDNWGATWWYGYQENIFNNATMAQCMRSLRLQETKILLLVHGKI